MEVYALVGPSGTGKSHRAIPIAHELDAEVIIDDGLLIKGTRILAGSSAKRQPTRIGAIKAALFLNRQTADEVKSVLKEINPKKVLLLATSHQMAERIAAQLELPPLYKVIFIEEVASPQEISKARTIRTQLSKHVIPAPTVEVKKRFPDTIIDPIQVLLRRKGPHSKRSWLEQSVVRPTFTSYGKLTITHGTLIAIAARAAKEVSGVHTAGKIDISQQDQGIILELTPVLQYGYALHKVSRKLQLKVKKRLEEMTGLAVTTVNIHVKELYFQK